MLSNTQRIAISVNMLRMSHSKPFVRAPISLNKYFGLKLLGNLLERVQKTWTEEAGIGCYTPKSVFSGTSFNYSKLNVSKNAAKGVAVCLSLSLKFEAFLIFKNSRT